MIGLVQKNIHVLLIQFGHFLNEVMEHKQLLAESEASHPPVNILVVVANCIEQLLFYHTKLVNLSPIVLCLCEMLDTLYIFDYYNVIALYIFLSSDRTGSKSWI